LVTGWAKRETPLRDDMSPLIHWAVRPAKAYPATMVM
jgi:hypothetical protein